MLIQALGNLVEKIMTRPGLPVTYLCIGVLGRDGIVRLKASEVIDTNQIAPIKGLAEPANPPIVGVLLMLLPAIEGVAPTLSIFREVVWRNPSDKRRMSLIIQFEQVLL